MFFTLGFWCKSALIIGVERTKRVKMFLRLRLRLRFRPRFCRRKSTDYQQFGDRETLTISMWSTNGAGGIGGGTGGTCGLLTQMERCIGIPGNAQSWNETMWSSGGEREGAKGVVLLQVILRAYLHNIKNKQEIGLASQ